MTSSSRKARLVVGLGFGDEGKGATVDYLTRRDRSDLVVRFNGGPQAAHHVVTPDGLTHCFSQFGAGTLAGASTFLSHHTCVEPLAAVREARALRAAGLHAPFEQLYVDRRCVVVTPFHKHVNRIRELSRGADRHGSCGMGVGQAVLDARSETVPSIRVGDLQSPKELRRRLDFLWRIKRDQAQQCARRRPNNSELREELRDLRWPGWVPHLMEKYAEFIGTEGVTVTEPGWLERRLAERGGTVIFEGAQGVLLDPDRGFWPHVTPTSPTFSNADDLIAPSHIAPGDVERLGVIRCYHTRHGAGPFVTESQALTESIPERHNDLNPWQGPFRAGWFDTLLARYALDSVRGVDALAVTHLDRLTDITQPQVCTAYRYEGDASTDTLTEFFEIEDDLDGPIVRGIHCPDPPERTHQRKLTEMSRKCSPILEAMPTDDFVDFLESEVGLATPVAIAARGPTAEDRHSRQVPALFTRKSAPARPVEP